MTDEQNKNGKADLENSQQGISQEGNLSKDPLAPLTSFSPKEGQMPPAYGSAQSPTEDNSDYRPQGNHKRLQKENQMLDEAQLKASDNEVKRLKQIERAYQKIIGQDKHPSDCQTQNWWRGLYRRQQVTDQVTDNDLLFVRKYPYSIILLLKQLQKTSDQKENSWFNTLSNLFAKWSGKEETITSFKEVEQQVINLTIELQQQQDEMRTLKTNYSSIRQKNDELELERGRLLKEIATLNTGGEDAPRPEILYSTFKELKDQKFKEFINRIFKLRSQCNPDAKVERKREIAKIRSKLAEAVLMDSVDICKEGNVTEAETDKLIKSVNGEFIMYFSNCSCSDVKTKFPTESQEITQTLESIARKSLKLVDDIIIHASSPGELMWYKEGTEFNPIEHEALVGCVEQGKIEFTVFPGYAVYTGDAKEKRIFEKATVFTTLEK